MFMALFAFCCFYYYYYYVDPFIILCGDLMLGTPDKESLFCICNLDLMKFIFLDSWLLFKKSFTSNYCTLTILMLFDP
jgi:hypothetical protein